jgi:hypothetical protein
MEAPMKGKSMSWLHTEKTACQEGGTYIFISEKKYNSINRLSGYNFNHYIVTVVLLSSFFIMYNTSGHGNLIFLMIMFHLLQVHKANLKVHLLVRP